MYGSVKCSSVQYRYSTVRSKAICCYGCAREGVLNDLLLLLLPFEGNLPRCSVGGPSVARVGLRVGSQAVCRPCSVPGCHPQPKEKEGSHHPFMGLAGGRSISERESALSRCGIPSSGTHPTRLPCLHCNPALTAPAALCCNPR